MNSPNDSNVISCKVVLLGESGVGKTSIIGRYVHNTFNSTSNPTLGASFAAKNVNFPEYDKNIKFEIWDTAGQEKYRALTKIFYKEASVAILCYDITRKETYDELKNYWYQQVKENAPKKIIFAIAANKSDLFENEAVKEAEGRAFAKEIGAVFKCTSAKSSTGIEEIFKNIGIKLIDPEKQTEEDSEDVQRRKQTVKISKGDKPAESQGKKGCC